MKAVKAKLSPDRVGAFEKGAQDYAKKIVANFKDFEFVRLLRLQLFFVCLTIPPTVYWRNNEPGWYGCSSELPGMSSRLASWLRSPHLFVVFRPTVSLVSCLASRSNTFSSLFWPRIAAYFTFWKDGLKEVKLWACSAISISSFAKLTR